MVEYSSFLLSLSEIRSISLPRLIIVGISDLFLIVIIMLFSFFLVLLIICSSVPSRCKVIVAVML